MADVAPPLLTIADVREVLDTAPIRGDVTLSSAAGSGLAIRFSRTADGYLFFVALSSWNVVAAATLAETSVTESDGANGVVIRLATGERPSVAA